MVQLRARGKNITITQQFEPELPAVWADEKSMRQVVAQPAFQRRKVHARKAARSTSRSAGPRAASQYISIRDNGPGIPEEEIPIVLSAFGQGSIAIKSAEQGTGLGLPIVQAILLPSTTASSS